MRSLLVTTLKILLVVVLALLVVLFVFGFVLWLDWPWWVGFFLLLGLAALGVGCLFLRKILLRRREQRFVQEVIAQDEARLKALSTKEKSEMQALQDRWKEAVDMLRRSHLRKQGNPLYVLPWYMVIGESGSGKTTAINSAKLSSPFAEAKRVQGISGTKNCEWWFFEQAVILDTAGRYAIPVDEGRDKDEWQRFLGLLLKYRRKEPLHGLIVTVPADKLVGGASAETLEEDGKSIRRRIDELMRVLGVKFPIYLLVTKCDLIQGMTRFSERLPEKALEQPMGFINQSLSKDVAAFLHAAMSSVIDRLKNIRLLLLHQPASKTIDPALLLFPEEFEQLGRGLEAFMKSAFQENPYQETPILRGLFFSSGHQEGTPYSHFLEALGLIREKEVLPGTNKGLFLHDFFARVLPSDRRLFAPTTRAVEWQKLTRNLGLTAWVLLGVAVCGLLSFSFVKNLNSIRSATRQMAQPSVMRGEFLADLVTMERFRQTVAGLETDNRNWVIPRFGLTESLRLEAGLKEKFCKQFHDGYLAPFDRQIQDVIPRLITSSSGSDELVGQYVVHLVRRINLLKARLDEVGIDELGRKPQPLYISLLSTDAAGPDTRKKFGNLYLSYITWRSNTVDITKEVQILQSWLKDLLGARGSNFQWLIEWVNKESGLPGVSLAQFWGGSNTLSDERIISPAFTRKGKGVIDAFLKEVEGALSDPIIVESQKSGFEKRYRAVAFDTWLNFAAYFPKGAGRLKGAKEWRQMASQMATARGAYLAFQDRVATELEPMAVGDDVPPWFQQVYRIRLAKAQGYLKEQGAVGRVAEQGKKLMATLEKKVGGEGQADTIEAQMAAGKAYQELITSVAAISSAAASRSQAFQTAAQVFMEEPGVSKAPFYGAQSAAARLKVALGQGRPLEDVVSRMVTGPVDFLWTTVRQEAACYLQASWEEKVLAEGQGATGQQAVQILLAPDGPVWRFIKGGGTAAPFIGWNLQRGYYAKEALGGSLPFDPSFFPFLVKGAKVQAAAQTKQSFKVLITGQPTDANPDAKLKPHETKLELQCASGVQSIANLNYPVTKTFTWTPDGCGDVNFQIEVGDQLLSKHYSGPRAFPDFLQDFRGGKRTFTAADFPAERAALDRMNIKFIKVNYLFSGEGQVVGQAVALPGQAARTITQCWAD